MGQDKNKLSLKVEKRTLLGRKVKKLRSQGLVVGNIFGKKTKSIAVQTEQKEFTPVFEKAGETGLVMARVAGEDQDRPTLITNVQKNPLTGQIIHFDLHQVDLKEKITAMVPVELVGESAAVKDKLGILIQTASEVEVEALPTDLPEKLELDITLLKQVDDNLTVAGLKAGQGVTILTDPSQILVKIEKPTVEEAPEPIAEEAAETKTTEGEQPAAGAEGEAAETPKSEETQNNG